MPNQFDEDEEADILTLVQLLRDYRAWGRAGKYVAATIKWILGVSAFLILFRDPLLRFLE